MLETAILLALVAAGAMTAFQGLLTVRGRRRAHPNILERPLIEALDLKEPDQINRVLGRLRLVYGLFLIAVGLWGMTV
ncbi:MAG: hypothetical protein ACP5JG_14770 [Anaerolineae bacterium]